MMKLVHSLFFFLAAARFADGFQSQKTCPVRTYRSYSAPLRAPRPATKLDAGKSAAVTTTFAGKLIPVLSKFMIGPAKASEILRNVLKTTHWLDFTLLVMVAYGTMPIARMVTSKAEKKAINPIFQLEKWHVFELISGLAKVGLSVYAMDVASVALTTMGFSFPTLWDVPGSYAKIAYSVFGLRRFLEFKTAAICKFYRLDSSNMGRFEVLDRLVNGLSVGLVSLLLFDWLSVQFGLAVKGLVAFGSVGTLAFTLASQGLVSQLLSGLFLAGSRKVVKGEGVQFGDGTDGQVLKMGWMETVIRGPDDRITSVPNAKLADQKITNLSRLKISQVKQTLRFHYQNAGEIPAVLESVKEEIRGACPKLIGDGSRPFRVYFTNFNEDHLEVTVDTHFYIAPTA